MTDETTYGPYGDGVDRDPYGQAPPEHAHDAAGGSHRVIPGELVPREDPNSGASRRFFWQRPSSCRSSSSWR